MFLTVRALFPVPPEALDDKPVGPDTKICSRVSSLSFCSLVSSSHLSFSSRGFFFFLSWELSCVLKKLVVFCSAVVVICYQKNFQNIDAIILSKVEVSDTPFYRSPIVGLGTRSWFLQNWPPGTKVSQEGLWMWHLALKGRSMGIFGTGVMSAKEVERFKKRGNVQLCQGL